MFLDLKRRYETMEDHELNLLSVRGNLTAEAKKVLESEITRRKASGAFKPQGVSNPPSAIDQRKKIPWWF